MNEETDGGDTDVGEPSPSLLKESGPQVGKVSPVSQGKRSAPQVERDIPIAGPSGLGERGKLIYYNYY